MRLHQRLQLIAERTEARHGRRGFLSARALSGSGWRAGNGQHDPPSAAEGRFEAHVKFSGAALKVSVSMPEGLTTAVQQRVGRGKFSQYVTEAVARQLELDLLAELSESLTAEYGPVPEEYVAEARSAWPDAE